MRRRVDGVQVQLLCKNLKRTFARSGGPWSRKDQETHNTLQTARFNSQFKLKGVEGVDGVWCGEKSTRVVERAVYKGVVTSGSSVPSNNGSACYRAYANYSDYSSINPIYTAVYLSFKYGTVYRFGSR